MTPKRMLGEKPLWADHTVHFRKLKLILQTMIMSTGPVIMVPLPRSRQRHPVPRQRPRQHGGHSRTGSAGPGRKQHGAFVAEPKIPDGKEDGLLLVVPGLQLNDLLTLRLVCKSWNRAICTIKGQGQAAPLWTKATLYFDATPVNTPGITNRAKVDAMTARFKGFATTTLVTDYHCPNYRFYRLDARRESARSFFKQNGGHIKALTLNHCVMSLVTFQRLLADCSTLEEFCVTGVFHCLAHAESLIPSRAESRLNGILNLRKLSFESSYVSQLNRRHRNGVGTEEDQLQIQDFHPAVIREILLSAEKLQHLTFTGFGVATVNRVLSTLARHPIHGQLVELGFYDITNAASPENLAEFSALGHLQLKKFALTFLAHPVANVERNGRPEENIDDLVRSVVVEHQRTLEVLELTNCTVSEAIFWPDEHMEEVPGLRYLNVQGTGIKGLSQHARFVLRRYLASDRVTVGLKGSGTIPRATVNDIIDGALLDSEHHGGGIDPRESVGGGGFQNTYLGLERPRGGFCNCLKIDVVSMAIVFVIAVCLILYGSVNYFGDTMWKVVVILSVGSYGLVFVLMSIITTSFTDG